MHNNLKIKRANRMVILQVWASDSLVLSFVYLFEDFLIYYTILLRKLPVRHGCTKIDQEIYT